MNKIEHIGIAVRDIEESIELYEKLLKTTCYKTESVESEGVKTAFFRVGESKIEILAATNQDSTIKKFIEKNGEGVHHIAFSVENIEQEIDRLQEEGFILISEKPKKGADNKIIAFLHPRSTKGVLIELCQDEKAGLE